MAKDDRYQVYVVQEGKDGESFWKEVGVAFENKDGSLALRLHLLGDVTMQVRRVVERDAERPANDRRGASRRPSR